MVIGKSEVDRARGPTVITTLLRDYVYPLLQDKLLPVKCFSVDTEQKEIECGNRSVSLGNSSTRISFGANKVQS